jgi:hypothetical protein
LSAWLRQYRVKRVGIEASGGYEQAVVARLRRDGFVVIVFQPAQVRAYAKFHLQWAKNDKIDASLIAACTAAAKKIHAPPDPRLAPMAEHQTLIDQVTDHIARCKNYLESSSRQFWKDEIKRCHGLFRKQLKQLVASIRQCPDLAARLDLIATLTASRYVPPPPSWCVCRRSAVSVVSKPPHLSGLLPMTTTVTIRRVPATSRAVVSATRLSVCRRVCGILPMEP